MDATRHSIRQTLLPVTPLVLCVICVNLLFVDASVREEERLVTIGFVAPDGSRTEEKKRQSIRVVDLDWRFGRFAIGIETVSASVLAIDTKSQWIQDAVLTKLLRSRAKLAFCLLPVAVIASFFIGWLLHWDAELYIHPPERYSSKKVVIYSLIAIAGFIGVLAVTKPWWPALALDLFEWYRKTVSAGFLPACYACVFLPVVEELFFRAGILRLLAERYPKLTANVLHAVLFSAVHLATPVHFLFAMVAGLILGSIYLATRNLYVVIGLHITANTALALFCLMTA